jgi:hypothetical protein
MAIPASSAFHFAFTAALIAADFPEDDPASAKLFASQAKLAAAILDESSRFF